MPESFANKSQRRVGVTSSVHTASIAAASDRITNISTFNVNVGALVDATQFIGGTRVLQVVSASNFGTGGEVRVDSTSSNVSAATTQTVGFNSVTAIDTPSEKSILVAGTLANNTPDQLKASVILSQHNNEHINVVHDVPIPAGSSLVLSDAGKLVVGIGSTVSVSVNTNSGVDVALSFLRGVS
jgi:hypothetical protein